MSATHFRLELYLVERRRYPLHSGNCVLAKCNAGFVSAHQHGLDIRCAAEDAEDGRDKKCAGRLGQNSEPVADLFPQRFYLPDVRQVRKPPINVELGVLGRYVVVWQVRGHIERDVRRLELGRVIAAQYPLDGLVEHPKVHVETDGVDEARLLGSQQVASAAQLEILERDLIAGAELRVVLENCEATVRIFVY